MAKAIQMAQLRLYLSGGAANADPNLSYGGAISSTEILNQLATSSASPTSGVALGDAGGNTPGTGVLTFNYSATAPTLQWQPPGGSTGTAVTVSTAGTYDLQGGSDGGTLKVTITPASLPTASRTESIVITNQALKVFDSVTKLQAHNGLTEYRCIFVKNTGTTATTDDKLNIAPYIAANTPGLDTITMGLAVEPPSTGAGVAGTDFPVNTGSETGVPAGVTFSSPTSTSTLTPFNLSSAAGTTYAKAIWFKREVPAGSYTETLGNAFYFDMSGLV